METGNFDKAYHYCDSWLIFQRLYRKEGILSSIRYTDRVSRMETVAGVVKGPSS